MSTEWDEDEEQQNFHLFLRGWGPGFFTQNWAFVWKIYALISWVGIQPYPYTVETLDYYLNTILLYVNQILFKITLITLDFHTIDNIKL